MWDTKKYCAINSRLYAINLGKNNTFTYIFNIWKIHGINIVFLNNVKHGVITINTKKTQPLVRLVTLEVLLRIVYFILYRNLITFNSYYIFFFLLNYLKNIHFRLVVLIGMLSSIEKHNLKNKIIHIICFDFSNLLHLWTSWGFI